MAIIIGDINVECSTQGNGFMRLFVKHKRAHEHEHAQRTHPHTHLPTYTHTHARAIVWPVVFGGGGGASDVSRRRECATHVTRHLLYFATRDSRSCGGMSTHPHMQNTRAHACKTQTRTHKKAGANMQNTRVKLRTHAKHAKHTKHKRNETRNTSDTHKSHAKHMQKHVRTSKTRSYT